jgi:hypothetical protein
MGRHASDFTRAVLTLLVQHKGEITHEDARPILAKMGVPIKDAPEQELSIDALRFEDNWGNKEIPEPQPKFDQEVKDFLAEYLKVRQTHEFQARNTNHLIRLREMAGERLGWTERKMETVYAEMMIRQMRLRKVYRAERNAFDVTKTNWKKGGKRPSKKNRVRRNSKHKSNSVVVSPITPSIVTIVTDTNDYEHEAAALRAVEGHGGLKATEAMLASLLKEDKERLEKAQAKMAETEKLAAQVELVKKLRQRLLTAA